MGRSAVCGEEFEFIGECIMRTLEYGAFGLHVIRFDVRAGFCFVDICFPAYLFLFFPFLVYHPSLLFVFDLRVARGFFYTV